MNLCAWCGASLVLTFDHILGRIYWRCQNCKNRPVLDDGQPAFDEERP